jgi:hypothetical protein
VRKATLAISDLHWGGVDHMPHVLESVMVQAAEEIGQLTDCEYEMVINGDAVVGCGIWRSQIWQQIMPDAHQQTWGVAWEISRHLSAMPAMNIRITKGQHDRDADGTDLAGDLALKLHFLGRQARYCGTETIVNLAPKGGKEIPCLFEHGYGFSSYYPFSYSLLRNTERKLLTYASMARRVVRCCFGHSHWLMSGYDLTPWLTLDCTGGFQRNDRAILGRGIRSSGAILYVGDESGALEIIEIHPDDTSLKQDLQDPTLEATNRQAIGNTMEAVTSWMIEQGLIEPDIIAKETS